MQETYTPYSKPNNNPIHIHKHSNHPQNTLRDLPKSISKRISDTSSNEEIFDNHIQQALENSGFNDNLVSRQSQDSNSHIHRNIKTNIGKIFFKLLRKHFSKTNKLYKIFYKNTVKTSYSCARNMGSIISADNKSLLTPNNSSFRCNCRNKNNCPLEGNCLTQKVIYQADVSGGGGEEWGVLVLPQTAE